MSDKLLKLKTKLIILSARLAKLSRDYNETEAKYWKEYKKVKAKRLKNVWRTDDCNAKRANSECFVFDGFTLFPA